MSKKYTTSILSVDELSNTQLKDIVNLYLEYYDGSSESLVLSDLKSKTKILLLFFQKKIVGFTTFEIYNKKWFDQSIKIIYSGDTVVHKKHWGQQSLAFSWVRHIGELKKKHPNTPIYWFLIVKGHRTYKYLPAFTSSFYPHWEKNCDDLKPLLNTLAKDKFGNLYNEESSIISFKRSYGHLKSEYAYPNENEKKNEAVQFFLKKNPEYINGNELACICSFDDENLRPFTKRILYPKGEVA